ncbi:hypothetical protein HZF08_05805 [Paenibacillus sp. CGMCC 1.16610]|uniref:Uncharacterized protein n=1 Tax=Paenibacillus anseongense TaxID=2682845 RepID=A0ABW9UBV9_9BACL|nr:MULTISPECIES: hypothetical protein [Paenibacillus]MBA2937813.1 hypothetical protein [Paenibacillus sp. CGMCC 1.16610]MVQ36871.1 hypothetical protein [Paenibacillus anseongense]
MMIGTIRLNFIVAGLAGLLTFCLSIGNNLLLTSCLKTVYSFLILFILTFGFRWVLGLMLGAEHAAGHAQHANMTTDSSVGQTLDLTTPEEDEETRELLKANMGNKHSPSSADMQFSPLNPPKLVTKNNLDPEQLAGALRRMSED